MTPSFLRILSDPSIRSVLICGCGGGFDFVHGLLLYPQLERLGKCVLIASYSFGDPEKLQGDATVVFDEHPAIVKQVTASTSHSSEYAPEVHVCSYLDKRVPRHEPHFIYASNSRTFAVPSLTRFYAQLVREHDIDAIVLVDGGSDALMVGDEQGLGDPIEDAVSVQAVAALDGVACKLLLSAGLGVDRKNGVSDASSMRAVAELSALGGFRGALAIEPDSAGHRFYREGLEHIYSRQALRSTVTAAVLAAIEGHYGLGDVSHVAGEPLGPDSLFVWPPMSFLWGFDVATVAGRLRLGGWLRDAETPTECYRAVRKGRLALGKVRRGTERLPDASAWPLEGLFDAEGL